MSDSSQGDGWWIASDGKWYPPELHPDAGAPAVDPEATLDHGSFERGSLEGDPAPVTPPDGTPLMSDRAAETLAMPAMASPPTPPDASAVATAEASATSAAPDPFLPTPAAADSGNRRGLIIGLVAVVLLVGLGFVAWRLLRGGSAGAASPEAAVQQLVDSVAEGDAVGIAEVFDPDEIEAWISSFVPASETAAAAAPDQTAGADQYDEFADAIFEALDVEITGPSGAEIVYEVAELDAEGRIARVRADGIRIVLRAAEGSDEAVIFGPPDQTVALELAGLDGYSLEVRDAFGGLEGRVSLPGQETVEGFADGAHLDLVTVEKDGGWFISPSYSIAENIRNAPDVSIARPDFGRAFRLVEAGTGGAETPEDAIRGLIRAIERLDYDEMIRFVDPVAHPWLHDYQPAIDREVDPRDLRDAAAEIDLRVSTLDLTTSEWNGRTVVEVNRLGGSVEGGTFEVDTRTWCAEAVSNDGERVSGCVDEAIQTFLDEVGSFDTDARDLVPDTLGFVVAERNGRWFVEPIGTFGFIADRVAESLGRLDLNRTLENSTGVAGFDAVVAASGPLVAVGESASAEASGGFAAVGVDLSGLDQPEVDAFDPMRIGLAQVQTDGRASFTTFDRAPADAEEWVVVYSQQNADEPLHPGLVMATDGPMTVSIEPIELRTIGADGLSGEIPADGRPLVFVMDDIDGEYEYSGEARFEGVSRWDDYGIVHRDGPWSQTFGDPSFGAFVVVTGRAGDGFEIVFRDPFVEPEPEPEPEPEQDPLPPTDDFDDGRVATFADLVAGFGYENFVFDERGGWFDGCGPDNPTAVTYGFEHVDDFELVLITTYESDDVARAAFQDLTVMTSPCEDFPGLVIDEIDVEDGEEAVTITYSYEDDPTPRFEYYARRGDTIVVASGNDFTVLLRGWEAIAGYPG